MSTANGTGAQPPLARNDYREGQILRARDLERESGYFLARGRQHVALAHIPGILHGLQLNVFERGTENGLDEAKLAEKGATPLDLYVEAGVAVDAYGRLVGVPRREQVRAELATAPSVLRAGWYRVVLLYDRSAGAGTTGGDACAGAPGSVGGGRTVREGYRIRLRDAYEALPDPPTPGELVDGPSDRPEDEAPVLLGLVQWNGLDSFIGFSLVGRRYAGVTAQAVASPDERARVELRDGAGRLAVRVADQAPVGKTAPFHDVFRVDDRGGVWVRTGIDAGPEGVRLRRDPDGQEQSLWQVKMSSTPDGSSFGKKPGSKPGEEVEVGEPPEYAPGEQEMRIVFERADVPQGRRRVVIGHVDRSDGAFLPAVVVYDRPPNAQRDGGSTVEVWGDLFVRGTAYLAGAQRVPRGGTPKGGGDDELDVLLRQLAGPLAGAFRAFLLSDPKWLNDLTAILAARVSKDQALVDAFTAALRGNVAFVSAIAAEAADDVAAALSTDAGLRTAVATQLEGDPPFLAALVTSLGSSAQLAQAVAAHPAVAQALAALPSFITSVANAVALQISTVATLRATVTTAVVARVVQDAATANDLAQAVAARFTATPAIANTVTDAVTARVGADLPRRTALRNALGI
ncbi:MAG TPA: hypothetical protein VFE05_08905 [Longimicrobiaceae bacterium]|jgi:hypothetical protein|nr:hypothetical protein [Longimicrobiaceae bacterium]